MNRYTIYCTEAQTRKALELGAPIISQSPMSNAPIVSYGETLNEYRKKVPKLYNCPTAEQMIGFLEDEFSLQFLTGVDDEDKFFFNVYYNESYIEVRGHDSRREATLAAIDAALEYLSNNKK